MAPDMFSGWGIRTYAAGQLGYNPIGYHTGTVWPHDVSLIAAGFKRYGRHEEANRLVGRDVRGGPALRRTSACRSCSAASTATTRRSRPVPGRLLAAGLGRRAPCSCSSRRCWASGRTPTAASWSSRGPSCPDWLQKVTISNLRVGDGAVDLLFHRWRGGTSAEVLRKSRDLDVTIRM